MTKTVTLATTEDSLDIRTYLERAQHLGCEHVWLVGAGNAVAAYVAVLTPQGLLDLAPTVLGLRVFERIESDALDVVVETRALLDRLAHDSQVIPLPVGQAGITWSGIAPPRGGWEQAGAISETTLTAIAQAGIDEVAKANGLGTNIVQTVRQEVWQRKVEDTDLPAGAAFAALGLGFLRNENAAVSKSGAWKRLTTSRGHVLIKNS